MSTIAFRRGQATSYYYCYIRMRGLRELAEIKLGKNCNLMAFNDFVIGQGLLPAKLLREAILTDFIPAQLSGVAKAN